MQIQAAPAGFIVPDMPVDGLMTDAQHTVPAQMPRLLLRAPLLAQQSVHTLQILQGEVQVAPRPGTPTAGAFNRFAGPIVPIEACTVSLELTGDRAAMAPSCLAICDWFRPCVLSAESIYLSPEVSWW